MTNHTPGLELTAEERAFRAELLEAAERLDVPPPELERRLRARIDARSRHRLPSPQAVAVAGFALAACVVLAVGLGRRGRQAAVTVEAEPQSSRSPSASQQPDVPALPAGGPVAGGRLAVWDGDAHGTGAQGWAAPTDSPKTRASIQALRSVGYAGTVGLKWQGRGPDWTGFGWNWLSWYPANAGTDISGYDRLVFKLRVEPPKRAADLPRLESTMVNLVSSQGSGGKATGSVKLSSHAPNKVLDGQWHEVSIPLKALYGAEKADGFDARTAWEFRLGEWSQDAKAFVFYLDDIGFEKTNK
jgi:hypothetical protein